MGGRVARVSAPPTSFDEIAADLQELRTRAGHPSYAEIARTISRRRTASGVPIGEARVAKSTVYDVFRTGRQRLDADLVTEVVVALGADRQEAVRWAERCRRAQLSHLASELPAVRDDLPPAAGLFVGRAGQLAQIVESEPGSVVAVTGLAGSGKSTLAFEAARRLLAAGRFAGVLRGAAGARPSR